MILRAVLSLLGPAGFRLMRRSELRIETTLLGAFRIAHPFAFYLIQRIDRYQVPMYPALLLPAGFASVARWQSTRKELAP